MITITPNVICRLQVAAAVFAVRGTRLTKTGTVQADIQLLRDRDAELYYSQRALKHVQKHIRRLSAEQPDVQWGFFITGDFTASHPDSLMSTVGLWCGPAVLHHRDHQSRTGSGAPSS